MKHNMEHISMEKATERPWSIEEPSKGCEFPIIHGGETFAEVAVIYNGEADAKANAALIVRTVNSHEALIEALKLAYSRLELCNRDTTPEGKFRDNSLELEFLDNAISRAEGRA